MISFIYSMFEWAFTVRVAVVLLLLLFLWVILGRYVLWLLSVIPYVFKNIFIILYLIIKMPIVFLHKAFGKWFYKLDNTSAEIGEYIHDFFVRWFKKWHYNYHVPFGKVCGIVIVCYLFIVIPSYFHLDINVLNMGKNIYYLAENTLKRAMEENFSSSELEKEWLDIDKEQTKICLTVYDVNKTLYVRDIPDKDNALVVDKLYNGDKVIWNGEIMFVEWGDEEVKPLVKVITENGTEGWSLFNYFYPEDYSDIELKVEEMK